MTYWQQEKIFKENLIELSHPKNPIYYTALLLAITNKRNYYFFYVRRRNTFEDVTEFNKILLEYNFPLFHFNLFLFSI